MSDEVRSKAIRDYADEKITLDQLKERLAASHASRSSRRDRPAMRLDELDGVVRAEALVKRIRV
jgi:hypothetical protein